MLAFCCSFSFNTAKATPGPYSVNEITLERSIEFLNQLDRLTYHPLIEANLILFRAKIGDEEICALLDTGASHSFLNLSLADRLELDTNASLGQTKTLGEPGSAFVTSSVRVEVPSQVVIEGRMLATEFPDIDCSADLKLTFVFGRDLLEDISILIDNPKGQIAFLPEGGFDPGEARHLHIDWVDGQIDIQIEDKAVRAELDTGLNVPLLVGESVFREYFAGKPLRKSEPLNTPGGLVNETVKTDEVTLAIVPGLFELSVEAVRFPDNAADMPISVGYPAFIYNPVVLDQGRAAVYIFPSGD